METKKMQTGLTSRRRVGIPSQVGHRREIERAVEWERLRTNSSLRFLRFLLL